MKYLMFWVLLLGNTAVMSVTGVITEGDLSTDDSAMVEKGRVSRSYFTSMVKNHEPVDNLLSLSSKQRVIYFFTELVQLNNQVVTHRWEYKGKLIADVKFNVKGNRWRVWSKKTLRPDWLGEWRVTVIGQNGQVLGTGKFEYTEANP